MYVQLLYGISTQMRLKVFTAVFWISHHVEMVQITEISELAGCFFRDKYGKIIQKYTGIYPGQSQFVTVGCILSLPINNL